MDGCFALITTAHENKLQTHLLVVLFFCYFAIDKYNLPIHVALISGPLGFDEIVKV